jgi:hypothetical protein
MNSLDEDNINGKVKTITTNYYFVVEKFGEAQKGDLFQKSILHYNVQGNKISQDSYSKEGSLLGKVIYKYDDLGNNIEYGNYDKNGNKLSFTTFKYDNKGNLIKYINYYSNGGLAGSGTYKYDNEGNRIESMSFNADSSLNFSAFYKYDIKGNCIEKKQLDKNSNLKMTTIYTYDDKENILTENGYSPNNQLIVTEAYQYKEFDEKSNWLKEVIITENKPYNIIERTIEYFDEEKNTPATSQNNDSGKKLNQEKAENTIKQFISVNNFGGSSSNWGEQGVFNENSISKIEQIIQFTENEASSIVHFNYRDAYADGNLILKFNFKKDIDKKWFLTSVEEVSGVGSQDMMDRIDKWQNINLPVQ